MEKRLLLLAYFDIFRKGGMQTSAQRILRLLSEKGWCGTVITEASETNYKRFRKFHNFDVKYVFPITPVWIPFSRPLTIVGFWLKDFCRMLLTTESLRKGDCRLVFVWGPPNFPQTGILNIFPFWSLLRRFRGVKVVTRVCGAGSSWMPMAAIATLFYVEELAQIRSSDRFVCVDHFILHDHYPRRELGKGCVITNTIDPRRFYPMPEKQKQDVVLFAGHLTEERGIWTFMKTANLLKRKGYRFVVVGEGPLREDLERYAKTNHMRVEFHGGVEYGKMNDVYNEAAVVVNPTPMEGIGNITLEAMACGRCVIRTRSKFRECVVEDGVNGLLFERDNPRDLAEKVERAMEDRSLRQRIEKEAFQTVLNDHTEEREAEKYDKLFKQLLDISEGD